jgi:hypothetical protein
MPRRWCRTEHGSAMIGCRKRPMNTAIFHVFNSNYWRSIPFNTFNGSILGRNENDPTESSLLQNSLKGDAFCIFNINTIYTKNNIQERQKRFKATERDECPQRGGYEERPTSHRIGNGTRICLRSNPILTRSTKLTQTLHSRRSFRRRLGGSTATTGRSESLE